MRGDGGYCGGGGGHRGTGVGRGYNLRIAIEMDWNNLLCKK